MSPETIHSLENIAYIVASILFILGIKMLGKATTAKHRTIARSVDLIVHFTSHR